ncbi:uncharacterized protein SETTUDRAFT_162803 [Exserohilum turcica Et28A]|uniref:Uncharacterized protein n=1 Tax=Exserohilum turcicum (strain 28A) TaxID=671987 RepID=R0IP95_EXST2|nr:uncharacterized protein SETTUDRAFT_162803 [Exserohilum turcica Et28A]EOA86561.1 hypothetical protein SETTUDRAFT_162803 [Exserohilum turcica Et28A]
MDDHRVDLLSHGQIDSPTNLAGVSQVVAQSDTQQSASGQIPSQPQASEQTRRESLEELSDDDMAEFPLELQEVLEECAKMYPDEVDLDYCYEIVADTASHYVEDETGVVGTSQTLKEANKEAVRFYVDEGYYASGDSPEYEAMEDGSLQIRVTTDGSTAGDVTIYIKEVPVRRTFGRNV